MSLTSLEALFEDQLKDLYSAEGQLVKALPKMAKAANSDDLREAFTSHLEETRGHVQRLDEISTHMEMKPTGKKCKAMEGLVEEGKEVLQEDGEGPFIDLALIAAAQRVEHYEISAYGSLRALAEYMGRTEVVQLLQETLDEESAADEKLTGIAEGLYPTTVGAEDASEEEESRSRSKSNGRSKARAGGRK